MDAPASVSCLDAAHRPEIAATRPVERPLADASPRCLLIRQFLTPAECQALIALAEQRGFRSAELDYPPSYRNNDRQVWDDDDLADRLFRRLCEALSGSLEESLLGDAASDWAPEGINARIRLCRYQPGQRFGIHQDGVHHRGPDCRSRLTFMIYLNDGEAFDGGDTLFYAAGPAAGEGSSNLVARLRPRAGSLILFDHALWHAGEEIARGSKYILRSDVMYRRRANAVAPASIATAKALHQGYVWALAVLGDGRIASGGRDGSIRLWSHAQSAGEIAQAHAQSVLGLAEIRPGLLASVSRDRTLRYWDLATQRCLRSIQAHEAAALCVASLPSGAVATGGADRTIRLWDADGGALGTLSGHTGWIWALAILDPDLLASASEDGSVRLWQLSTKQCLGVLPGQQPLRCIDADALNSRAGTPRRLITGDAQGQVTVWTLGDHQPRMQASFKAHDAAVRQVRLLRDGSLATAGEDQQLRFWHGPDYALAHEEQRDNFVTDVLETACGELVACGYDGRLWWPSRTPASEVDPPALPDGNE